MAIEVEHDIVRPWACCQKCKNEYERKRRASRGRKVDLDRLRDSTLSASRHDDKIDTLLEILHG